MSIIFVIFSFIVLIGAVLFSNILIKPAYAAQPYDYAVSVWNLPSNANYKNPSFPTSSPSATFTTSLINYDFGTGSPSAAVSPDHFVVRAIKNTYLEGGIYDFSVTSDDGVRVIVDGDTIINDWNAHSAKTSTASKTLVSGNHTITIEYFENVGNAVIRSSFVGPRTGTSTPTPPPVTSSNPLYGKKFAVKTDDPANQQVSSWLTSRPADAEQIRKIATTPRALWVGGWNTDITSDVDASITKATGQGAIQTLVAYNIPNRDCGSLSAGGASSRAAYTQWINNFAAGLKNRQTIVVVEPDALGQLDTCLNAAQQSDRLQMIKYAVTKLTQNGALVYIDASMWIDSTTMANRLNSANIAGAQGVAINTSNFQTSQSAVDYANQLSPKVGGKHFIVDTSRNGQGPKGSEWCNPTGRGLGQKPNAPQSGVIDAYLWVKGPGESDGTCNGGPSAGTWWPDYALSLAKNSRL